MKAKWREEPQGLSMQISKLFAKINDMLEGGSQLVFVLIDEVRAQTHANSLLCPAACLMFLAWPFKQYRCPHRGSGRGGESTCNPTEGRVSMCQVESLAASREASGSSEPADSVRAVNALLTQLDTLKVTSKCFCKVVLCNSQTAALVSFGRIRILSLPEWQIFKAIKQFTSFAILYDDILLRRNNSSADLEQRHRPTSRKKFIIHVFRLLRQRAPRPHTR